MDTPFDIAIIDGAQEFGSMSTNVDFAIYHGATDAPAVDIIARNVITLADDLAYGESTMYISVPAIEYILDITPANDNTNVLVSYDANLNPIQGSAGVAFASGFLNPPTMDDPAFGIFLALADGTVIELPVATTSTRNELKGEVNITPNLINSGYMNISIEDYQGSDLQLRVIDGFGKTHLTQDLTVDKSTYIKLNVSQLSRGTYFVQLTNGSEVSTKRFVVQ